MRSIHILPVLASVSSISLTQAAHSKTQPQFHIKWMGPCALQNSTNPIVCGTLEVPLDYTNTNPNQSDNQMVTLDLAKVAATPRSKVRKKSILLNFGGPGESSFENMIDLGPQLSAMLGGQHDLITFNVRGDANTLPFSCYTNQASREIDSLQSPVEGTAYDTALETMWNDSTVFAEKCYSLNKETGGLIGTAFVARDMMQIVDALGEDGLLHYWGFSYGTTLGAVVVNMFPDRMGSIVLDGVLNPHEYFHGYDVEMALDTDKVFAGFCSNCLATPDLCPLAQNNYSSAADLEENIYRVLDTIRSSPVPKEASTLTYEAVKQEILSSLYETDSWPGLSRKLNDFMTGNFSGLVSEYSQAVSSGSHSSSSSKINGTLSERLAGIKCSDKAMRASKLSQVQPYIQSSWNLSRIAGDMNDQVDLRCAQWKMPAKERYNGDFHVKTLNPVLLVSNRFDPVTPLASAYNLSESLEGSVVLVNNGYGHSSLGQLSKCTAKKIQQYFSNNTLPSNGTLCEPSFLPFHPETKTWRDLWS